MKKTLLCLTVLFLLQLACKVTVTTPLEPEEARVFLEGRTAVVFGNSDFLANAFDDLEATGMELYSAHDLREALELPQVEGFIEINCFAGEGGDPFLIAHAESPEKVDVESDLLLNCEYGIVFVGFMTTVSPTLIIP